MRGCFWVASHSENSCRSQRNIGVGKTVREWLEPAHLLSYLEAILRVYNLLGRRDNMYKARIKILVNATGIDEFRRQVEEEPLRHPRQAARGQRSDVGRRCRLGTPERKARPYRSSGRGPSSAGCHLTGWFCGSPSPRPRPPDSR